MKLNSEKWVAAFKQAAADLKEAIGSKPSSGEVCAVATLRVVRDALIESKAGDASKLKAEFSELIQACQKEKLQGFASNASAAAKAAGFKPDDSGASGNYCKD
jgi:hypothetical protein